MIHDGVSYRLSSRLVIVWSLESSKIARVVPHGKKPPKAAKRASLKHWEDGSDVYMVDVPDIEWYGQVGDDGKRAYLLHDGQVYTRLL